MDIEKVVREYREPLIYFIERYIKDLDIAEDIAEDVFVELIVHPNRFKEESKLKTYLFAIGRNKAIDYVRKNLRREAFVENYDEENDSSLQVIAAPILEQPLESIVQKEKYRELSENLNRLKPEYKEALTLIYVENLSYEEASKVMHKNRKQVENLVARAKVQMRNFFNEKGDINEN